MDILLQAVGLDNPEPRWEGQCIVGQGGIPLVAARIVPQSGSPYTAWRAAEVKCGLALDGAVQSMVKALEDRSPNAEKVIHLDPEIYNNKGVFGALQTIFGGLYRLTSTQWDMPREGNVHVKVPRDGDNIVVVYKASPTVTETGKSLGVIPKAEVVPTSTAAQLDQFDQLDQLDQSALEANKFGRLDPTGEEMGMMGGSYSYGSYRDAILGGAYKKTKKSKSRSKYRRRSVAKKSKRSARRSKH